LSLSAQERIMKAFQLILLLSLASKLTHAQFIEDCRRPYDLLKEVVSLDMSHLEPGKFVYLSQNYLDKLEEGAYKQAPSEIVIHAYVRPASKKELKSGKISGDKREFIGSDGNIYVPKVPSSYFHFFRKNKAFEGDYRPIWKDSEMTIPIGLEPVDVQPLASEKFEITQKHPDYLIFKAGNEELVYYVGYPKVNEVFDSEEILNHISQKQEIASEFIGHTWYIRPFGPHYRGESEMTAPSDIFYTEPLVELTFDDVTAFQNRVKFGAGQDTIQIDSLSEFLILDKGCVLSQQQSYAEMLREDFDTENIRLRKTLKNDKPSEWKEEPWVQQSLYRRFWISPNLRKDDTYSYVLLEQEEAEASYVFGEVDQYGNAWLKSHFASDEGLYHTRIIVKIRGVRDSLESERVSTRDERYVRTYLDSTIVEEIIFDSAKDQKILEKIAKNAHRKIFIRYKAGGKYYKDIELPELQKEQIRDSWMLAQIIKQKAAEQD
jgi:hypothetical protein